MPILRCLESFSLELSLFLLLLLDPKAKEGLGAAGAGALAVVAAAPPNMVDGVVVVAGAGVMPNLGLSFVLSEDGGLADDESKVNGGLGAAVVEVSVVWEPAPNTKAVVGAE